MEYSYKALTKDGRTVSGTMDAPSKAALIESLNKQNLTPIVVRESGTKGSDTKGSPKGPVKARVKSKELVVFTRQLSTMISAGVPLPKALDTLGKQAESQAFKTVVSFISKDVESGQSLGDAFGKHPNVFSEVYVSMVRAGEEGGILDEILKRLATQTEKDARIRKKIKGAMTYPAVILSVTVLSFFGLMILVIPRIGKILTDLGGPDAKLPIYTQLLLDFTNFNLSSSIVGSIPGLGSIPIIGQIPNMLFSLLIVGAGIYYALRYTRTTDGKYQFHKLLLKIPVIKVIIVKVAISRFSRTFASLSSAGVAVLEALAVTGGAIGNKVIQAELAQAAIKVQNGKSLSESISECPHFPPIVTQMLAVGEETGKIDTVLVKVADFYDEEVDTVIDSLSSIIEPVMIIVLGSAVGLIAASVMGPIASLSQNIGD